MILWAPAAKVMVPLQQSGTDLVDLLVATMLDPAHLAHQSLILLLHLDLVPHYLLSSLVPGWDPSFL